MVFFSSQAPAAGGGAIFCEPRRTAARFAPLEIALAFALLAMASPLFQADKLFNDPDTLWHIHYGQELLRTGVFPRVDSASFTAAGLPWITKEWLSQVILAGAHAVGGWVGVTLLILACVGATVVIIGLPLAQRLPPLAAALILASLPVFWTGHLLARPHMLAFPVIALWMVLLARAADRFEAPHPAIALLMILWANLHGGFTLGLALAAGLAAETVLHAPADQRQRLVKGWGLFLGLAFMAALCTPFGVDSLLVTRKVFALGPHLTAIEEWKPFSFQDETSVGPALLAAFGAILILRPRFRAGRIALALFVLYLAMTYARNLELAALVLPALLLGGLSRRLAGRSDAAGERERLLRCDPKIAAAAAAAVVAMVGLAIWMQPSPPASHRPEAALAFARERGLDRERVFNAYAFGGYLITQGIPTFIDGRTELFPKAVHDAYRAVAQLDGDFIATLDEYKIAWVLMPKGSQLPAMLELSRAWTTAYRDEIATILVRSGRDSPTASR